MAHLTQIDATTAAIEGRMSRLAAVMNSTGLYTALRHDEHFKAARNAGMSFATQVLSGVANSRVHDSLNIVEKFGFDPFGRVARRKQYAAAAVGVANFSMQVGLDLFLYSQEQNAKRQSLLDLAAWMGFAHGAEPTLRMVAHVARVAAEMQLADIGGDFSRHFEPAVGHRVVSLPRPSDRRRLVAMLMDVAAVVDTKEPQTNERLKELTAYAGYAEGHVQDAVADFDEVNELSSDVAGVTGGVVGTALKDMFGHAHAATAAAEAAFQHDPFAETRRKRREVVQKVGVTAGLAALTYFTGPVGDFLLVAAAPVVNAAVGGPDDVQAMLRISKTLRHGLGLAKPPGGGRSAR